MHKTATLLFGISMLLLGLMGFSSLFVKQSYLLGTFRVNFECNLLHLVTGILLILSAYSGASFLKNFCFFVSFFYALFTVSGIVTEEKMVWVMFANNNAGNWLHACVSFLGFALIGSSSLFRLRALYA